MKQNNLFSIGVAAMQTWQRMVETSIATDAVLRARSKVIADAVANPLNADTAELGRMIPEKTRAFGRAGKSISTDMQSLARKLAAQNRDLAKIAARGGVPTRIEARRISARGIAIIGLTTAASARALKPIHATVTANQKRLKCSATAQRRVVK